MRKEWQEKLKEKNIEIKYENERRQKERKGQKFWIKIIEGKREIYTSEYNEKNW